MNLNFSVTKQLIRRTDSERPVAKSRNYLHAVFSFSQEWQGTVTAIFTGSGITISQVLDSENKCLVPWEVIEAPGFSVSCYCGNRITANKAFVNVKPSGYAEGETPGEPTPSVYEQLTEMVDEAIDIAQSVRDDADAGEFDGADGQNAACNYSATEQVIGTWLNGKPLYQKTVSYNLTTPSDVNAFALIGADIDTVVNFFGTAKGIDEDYIDFADINQFYGTKDFLVTSVTNQCGENENEWGVTSYGGTNLYCPLSITVTVQYTKANDTVNSQEG